MEEKELLHLHNQDIISKKGLFGRTYYVVLDISGNKYKLAKLTRTSSLRRRELENKVWEKTSFLEVKIRLA